MTPNVSVMQQNDMTDSSEIPWQQLEIQEFAERRDYELDDLQKEKMK